MLAAGVSASFDKWSSRGENTPHKGYRLYIMIEAQMNQYTIQQSVTLTPALSQRERESQRVPSSLRLR